MKGSLFGSSSHEPFRHPFPRVSPGNLGIVVSLARATLLFLTVAVISGCAAPARNGASFTAASQTLGPPKAGNARIVVFRDKGYAGLIDAGWPIRINDAPMGNVKTGTFIYADRPAGRLQLSFIGSNLPRASRHDVNAAPGRTYFFKVELNEKGRLIAAGSASAGLAGLLVTSVAAAAADERGAYDFIPVDEATARQVLAEYGLAE